MPMSEAHVRKLVETYRSHRKFHCARLRKRAGCGCSLTDRAFEYGRAHLVQAETKMNKLSSRSHAVRLALLSVAEAAAVLLCCATVCRCAGVAACFTVLQHGVLRSVQRRCVSVRRCCSCSSRSGRGTWTARCLAPTPQRAWCVADPAAIPCRSICIPCQLLLLGHTRAT